MTTDREDREDQPDQDDQAAAPGSAPENADEHRDDGLDLARRTARATAGAGGQRARRKPGRRKQPGEGAGRRGTDDRDPQLLDSTLSRLVADHGWELDLRVRGVLARWPDIVGPEIAGHAEPESFADGRLVVRTDSTAWATQLRLLAPQVVARLNEDLGPGTVSVLEVLGPHLPSWRKGPRSVRDGRGPRDTYG